MKRIIYDKEADSLLMLWGENKPAESRDIGGEFWLREIPETGEITGIEIENFKAFAQKHQLYPQPLPDEVELPSRYTGLYDDWFFSDCGSEMTWGEFKRRSEKAQQSQPLDEKGFDKAIAEVLRKNMGIRVADTIHGKEKEYFFPDMVAEFRALLQQREEEARKAGFGDGVEKTTVAIDSTIDAQLEEAKREERERIMGYLERYHTDAPFHNFTVYLTEEEWQALKGESE